jgi:inorganic phosphate transporter, PiT family
MSPRASVGAVLRRAGLQAISLAGIGSVLLVLVLSPLLGFAISYGITRLVLFLLQGARPSIGRYLRSCQWLLAPVVALSEGTNDGQKIIGIVALGLASLHP